LNDQKKRNKKKSSANILDYPLMRVVAFVATAICAKWVPVSGCQCREEEDEKFKVQRLNVLSTNGAVSNSHGWAVA